jgi:stage V sporulation protein G
MSIEIKINRIHKMEDATKNIQAFADIEINDAILVKGLKIMRSKGGELYISMPRQRGKDNVWYETVRALTPEAKEIVNSVVLAAYQTPGK